MSVMAEIGWQGLFTVAVIVVTLAMLLWERFSPDRVLVAAAGALMVSGVLTPAEALTGFWNPGVLTVAVLFVLVAALRSEEHTSELQSLMRISYAVFCLKQKRSSIRSKQV